MQTVKEIIKGMLQENTGIHMLDSGGAYGRHWEKNQARNFEQELVTKYEVYSDKDNESKVSEIIIQYNLYHYLTNFLEYNEECQILEKRFFEFAHSADYENESWFTCVSDFIQDILDLPYNPVNTYNYENLLSQVIQYAVFEHLGENYIIIQIHNVCDVREGYTKPRIFKLSDYDYFVMAQYDVNLYCTGEKTRLTVNMFEGDKVIKVETSKCQNNWGSDDSGNHYYYDGCSEDKKPLLENVYIQDDKLYCKECNGEIAVHVLEEF